MKCFLSYIKDVAGNNYIGVNIYPEMIYTYLENLKGILSDEYQIYVDNQKNRDHGKYHITVINVMEYNKLSKERGPDKLVNSLEKYFESEFDITLIGLGTASKNENQAYFVVVSSPALQSVRKMYGLPEKDFHITIGFKWKDVFGVRKNQVLQLIDPFLKLLKTHYYNDNETFNFVKYLVNYDGDEESEVNPISINDTQATFKIGSKYYTVSLIEDDLMVTALWDAIKDNPILPNTIIYRKFKNI